MKAFKRIDLQAAGLTSNVTTGKSLLRTAKDGQEISWMEPLGHDKYRLTDCSTYSLFTQSKRDRTVPEFYPKLQWQLGAEIWPALRMFLQSTKVRQETSVFSTSNQSDYKKTSKAKKDWQAAIHPCWTATKLQLFISTKLKASGHFSNVRRSNRSVKCKCLSAEWQITLHRLLSIRMSIQNHDTG